MGAFDNPLSDKARMELLGKIGVMAEAIIHAADRGHLSVMYIAKNRLDGLVRALKRDDVAQTLKAGCTNKPVAT